MSSLSRLRRITARGALALCAALPFAASAQAATPLVNSGAGLTLPSGVAEGPAGSIWVADGLNGICRVDPARADVLVPSEYCAPHPAPLAPPRPGPSVAFQMAFDALSSNLFVAEGSSKDSGVWRMHVTADGLTIDSAERVVSAGLNRVFALALGVDASDPAKPAAYVDFNGRDDGVIHRLANAATAAPVGISATQVVGVSNTPGVLSMANLDGALYLAENTGVSRIATPGPSAAAASVAGFPAGAAVPNALVADPARGRVYAGTANPSEPDRVDVLTAADGMVSTYDSPFFFVGGLALRGDGSLLVGDDPSASGGANHPVGQGRLWSVALQTAHLPAVTITSGPQVYSSSAQAMFTFTSAGSATFSCRVDGGAEAPCEDPSGPDGSQSYAGLAEGSHSFEVRVDGSSRVARYAFLVDRTAPTVQVDNPASDKVTDGDALRVRFSSGEFGVTYACELDGGYVHACDPPVWLRGFDLGKHTLTVTPTDLAGNVGATLAWTFERVAPPPAPPAPVDSSGPGPEASASATPDATSAASSVAPACRPLAGQARKGSYKLAGRVLTVRITAPSEARYAKLSLRPRGLKQGETVTVKPLTGTGARDVRVVLTRAQAVRLRSRRATLTVGYGSCSKTIGPATELSASATKASRA
jgi:hypothetical protein